MTFSKHWGDKSTSVPSYIFEGDDTPVPPKSPPLCRGGDTAQKLQLRRYTEDERR